MGGRVLRGSARARAAHNARYGTDELAAAREFLAHFASGAQTFEDWSWRGMSHNAGAFNDRFLTASGARTQEDATAWLRGHVANLEAQQAAAATPPVAPPGVRYAPEQQAAGAGGGVTIRIDGHVYGDEHLRQVIAEAGDELLDRLAGRIDDEVTYTGGVRP